MQRRTIGAAAIGLGVVLAATLSGCGDNDTTSAAPSAAGTSATGAPSASTDATSGASATTTPAQTSSSIASSTTVPAGDPTKDVTNTYVTFFDGKTPADKKVALVENGQAFAEIIRAQAESPAATGTTATVTDVRAESPGRAAVTFTVSVNGRPALQNQQGAAVESDGTWKVSADTFCTFLSTAGSAPSMCGAPSAAAPTN